MNNETIPTQLSPGAVLVTESARDKYGCEFLARVNGTTPDNVFALPDETMENLDPVEKHQILCQIQRDKEQGHPNTPYIEIDRGTE